MGTPTLHLDLEKILNQPTYPEILVKKQYYIYSKFLLKEMFLLNIILFLTFEKSCIAMTCCILGLIYGKFNQFSQALL